MNHPSLTNFSEADYTEVLSHEIGHSLGLAHSSEDDNEPTDALEDATMYFKVHKDGRGSTLTTYDKDQIQFGYPENTPPFGSERLLRVVSGTPQPTGPGTDRVTAAGADLEGTPLTIEHLSAYDTGAGTFSLSGDQLIYTLVGNYGDAILSEAQLAGTTAYGRCYFRFSDGTNTSPPYTLRITGFHYDTSTSDGLPNSWMSAHFGTTSPGAVGTDRHQDSDPDGDGVDNKTERYLGTDPNDAASGPPMVSFDPTAELLTLTPTRYATHRLQTSSDLQNWTNSTVFTQIDTPTSIDLDAPAPTTSEPVFYRFDFGP